MHVQIGEEGETYPTRSTYFPKCIETERLTLRALQEDDVSLRELNELFSEETTKHLLTDPHGTFKETGDYLEPLVEGFEEGTRAAYVMRPRTAESDAGEFAGVSILQVDWDRRSADWGIVLRKPFWGRSYTKEKNYAFAHLVFSHFELEVVEIACLVSNEYAKRAIEDYIDEFGGHYVGVLHNEVVPDDGEPKDCHRFTITRSEYLESEVRRAVE